MLFGNIFGTFFSYTYKTYGESQEYNHKQISDTTLTWAASIGAGVVNGISRVSNGILADKYSFKTIFGFLMVLQFVNSLVAFWAAYFTPLFFLSVLVNYYCLGGLFAVFPVAVTNVFGLEFGPQIYVWILLGSCFCSLINLACTEFISSVFTKFYLGAAAQLACLLVLYFYEETVDEENIAKHMGFKDQ